jgi:hypothetical protein
MRLLVSLIVTLGCLVSFPANRLVRAAGDLVGDDTGAVARFINDVEKGPIPYEALRHLEASSVKLKESAWMEAFTEYTHEGGFRYRVLSQGGSERICNRALRGVLDAEKESAEKWREGALTRDNYEFNFDSRTPDGLIKVQLNPRRRDSRLIDGTAWLSPHSGDLVRVEGRLSKSPSFWIRSVSVTRHYVLIGGTMMPAAMESTADIRMAGISSFLMTYEYAFVGREKIASREARIFR